MRRNLQSDRGVALVLTLAMLALITILIVGLSSIMATDRYAAGSAMNSQNAKIFADMARDHASAMLRDAIESGRVPAKFWVSQPGKITVFKSDGTVDTTIDLSSGTAGISGQVDLNQATFTGNNPIASSVSTSLGLAPSLNVDWVNVNKDLKQAFDAQLNPVVGRYAFWIDDESSKVNINTADGTSKYVAPDWSAGASPAPVSFGNGMPTEVSLQALTNSLSTSYISAAVAESIASITGVRPSANIPRSFSHASEMLLASTSSSAYNDNNFSLTSCSRSPEINIFGEPKINLLNSGGVVNLGAGPTASFQGIPLRQIYPNSNQLPPFTLDPSVLAKANAAGGSIPSNISLPQCFDFDFVNNNTLNFNYPYPTDYPYLLGLRIAQYLKGYNSQGNAITWPHFAGSTANGFGGQTGATYTGKYTDRQIDSIALQMLDLIDKDTQIDVAKTYGYQTSFCVPYIMQKGFLSGLPVKGLPRGPHPTQVEMTFTVQPGVPASYLSLSMTIQWYLPKEYKGVPLAASDMSGGRPVSYGWNGASPFLNLRDAPQSSLGIGKVGNGYWMNQLLHVTAKDGIDAENDLDAGIDFWGNANNHPDPDQIDAKLYHPNLQNPSTGLYMGSGLQPENGWPMLNAGFMAGDSAAWNPGEYHSSRNNGSLGVFYQMRALDPNPANVQPFTAAIKSINITGGIAIWTTYDGRFFDVVPIDSVRGYGDSPDPILTDPNVRQGVLAGVIPMPPGGLTILVPEPDTLAPLSRTVVFKVADPLVNNLPGDWVATPDPTPDEVTLISPDDQVGEYANGASAEFQAAGGGDPISYWVPEVNENIPKSARFPSVGYLQYIRTGLMADPANDPDDPRYAPTIDIHGFTNAPHGTPFRLLSMAPSYDPRNPTVGNPGQTTAGGGSYPDWAMLDLFTVPVVPQPLPAAATASDPTPALPPELEMSYGGSTPGRVNVNGSLLPAAFSAGATRLSPLEAVFQGLQVSNSYGEIPSKNMPELPVITTVNEKEIAKAIHSYELSLGRPLMMASEVANVTNADGAPGVADYTYTNSLLPGSAQPYWSRNDLVRQSVGNLTTQSNTFSIWAIGQAIKTLPDNSTLITGESRMHYIVERYIDCGTDGVPGNATPGGAGGDDVVGTPDDVVSGDATHPGPNPAMSYPLPYKYRIISAEETAN